MVDMLAVLQMQVSSVVFVLILQPENDRKRC